MLPQDNATLLSVQRGGTVANFDEPAGAGSQAWAGTVRIYITDEDVAINNGAGRSYTVVTSRVIMVDEDALNEGEALFKAGDKLTWEQDGVGERTGVIETISRKRTAFLVAPTKILLKKT